MPPDHGMAADAMLPAKIKMIPPAIADDRNREFLASRSNVVKVHTPPWASRHPSGPSRKPWRLLSPPQSCLLHDAFELGANPSPAELLSKLEGVSR